MQIDLCSVLMRSMSYACYLVSVYCIVIIYSHEPGSEVRYEPCQTMLRFKGPFKQTASKLEVVIDSSFPRSHLRYLTFSEEVKNSLVPGETARA